MRCTKISIMPWPEGPVHGEIHQYLYDPEIYQIYTNIRRYSRDNMRIYARNTLTLSQKKLASNVDHGCIISTPNCNNVVIYIQKINF